MASGTSSRVSGALDAIFGSSRMVSGVMRDPDAVSDLSKMASGVRGASEVFCCVGSSPIK